MQKLMSELVERSFAHMYDTGGMRPTHLRGRDKILKRVLIQAAAFNLALMIRLKCGMGKPRGLGRPLEPGLALRIALAAFYLGWPADHSVTDRWDA